MKKYLILLSVLLLVGCTPAIITHPEEIIDTSSYPTILGGVEFIADIEGAIHFIQQNSPEIFRDIDSYVQVIILSRELPVQNVALAKPLMRQIFIADHAYELYKNNPEQIDLPQYFLPRVLVHELTHIKNHVEKRGYSKLEEERSAIAAERDFLTILGVDEDMIEKMTGEHRLELYFNH